MMKAIKIVLSFFLLLVLARMALPAVMKELINWYLENRVEGYVGEIEDFDLALWKGNYSIEGLKLNPKTKTSDEPDFLFVDDLEVSLAWRALLKGRLLMDLEVDELSLYFVDNMNKEKRQLEINPESSRNIFDTLIPFKIERLTLKDSSISFVNTNLKVPSRVEMSQITALAEGIHNHKNNLKRLPSTLNFNGKIQRSGNLHLYSNFSILEGPLALDIDFKIEGFELNELNSILLAYGPLSFTSGNLSVYGEAAVEKNHIKGYIKPFVNRVDVVASEEIFLSLRHFGFEMVTAGGNIILRSPAEKVVATKLEFEGPMRKIDMKVWDAFWLAIKNAFSQELELKIDNTIELSQ